MKKMPIQKFEGMDSWLKHDRRDVRGPMEEIIGGPHLLNK
jgi:hypothetical protein